MRYEDTPLYTRSYCLTKELVQRCAQFPRHYRPSLGSKLEQAAMELTTTIMTAFVQPGSRSQALQQADEMLNRVRLALRLSKDIGLFTSNQHSIFAKEVADIGALLGAWRKREDTHTQESSPDT